MSIPITFNGVEYDIPEFRDTNYANELTQFFTAIPNGVLQPTGGLFTLLAEADFGASFGLKSLYYKSRGSNISTAGILRLASAEAIGWRNNANGADLLLTTNASDELLFNGAQVLTGAGPSSYVSSITGTANQVVASGATGAVTLSLPQSIATSSNLRFGSLTLNGAADASALLTLASTTQGFLPPRMTTAQRDLIAAPAEGLVIYNTTTAQMNLYSTGLWTALTMTAGGSVNAGTQYQLGYYAANGTAISGLTAITASRALASDANGLPVAATTTATELDYLSGVTSAIQTQLDLKAPLASPTFTGTVTIPTPFTLGATSVTATGAELNYLVGVSSAIQTQLDAKAATNLSNVASVSVDVPMNSHKFTGLAAGTGNGDSLRYEQLIGQYLLLSGGTMSGAIAMGTSKITGLGNGDAVQDAAAFGQLKVLKVGYATSTTAFTSTSSTYQTTNSSVSFACSRADSKVYVFAFGTLNCGAASVTTAATIFADAVDLDSSGAGLQQLFIGGGGVALFVPAALMAESTPGSTSAVTYSVKIKNSNNSTSIGWGNGPRTTIIVVEVNQL